MLHIRNDIAVLCCLIVGACGGGSSESPVVTPPKVLTSISVSLGSGTLQVGQTTTALAAGLDQNGAAISTGAVSWSSATTSVATVNATSGVLTAVAPGTTFVTGTASGKQSSATLTVIAVPVSGKYRIVFARGSICHREDPFNCDLYFADVDMTTMTAITAPVVIANRANVAEWFPGLSSSGRFVVYNQTSKDLMGKTINQVWYADLNRTGSSALLMNDARFPQIASDDKKLYFSREGTRNDLFVADITINESAGTITAGTATSLTGGITAFAKADDPFPIGATGQIAFHYQTTDTSPSAVAVFTQSSSSYVTVASQSGHASVNSNGTIVSSSLGGTGVAVVTSKTGGWNAAQIVPFPGTASTFIADDVAFQTRAIARWSYPEWIDDGHIIASVMAGTVSGGENLYSMSRLYLGTLNGSTYLPLFTLLGGINADYCTVATRVLK